MQKIKHRIIHFLGGFVYSDFTPIQQAIILQMQAERARDHQATMRLLSDIGMPNYFEKKI